MSEPLNPQNPFSETSAPTASPSPEAAAEELRAAATGSRAQQVKEAAAERAGALKDVVTNRAAAIRDNAGETAAELKGVAGEQWQDTQLKAKELHASLEDTVRANPTQAVLTAAAAGFILGLIIRR